MNVILRFLVALAASMSVGLCRRGRARPQSPTSSSSSPTTSATPTSAATAASTTRRRNIDRLAAAGHAVHRRLHLRPELPADPRRADERPVRPADRRLHRRRHRPLRLADPPAPAGRQRHRAAARRRSRRPGAEVGRLRDRACSASGTSARRASTTPPAAGSTRRSSRRAALRLHDRPPRSSTRRAPTSPTSSPTRRVDFIRGTRTEPFFLYLPHFGVHSPLRGEGGADRAVQGQAAGRRAQRPDLRGDDRQRRRERRPGAGDARRAEAGREHAGHLHQRQRRRRRLRPRGDQARRGDSPTTPRSAAARACSTRAASACRTSSAGRARSPPGIDVRRADQQRRPLPHPARARRREAARRISRSTASATCRCSPSGGERRLDRDAIYWHFPGYLGAGRGTWRTTPGQRRSAVGDWKLMEFFEDGRLELYNLRDDIGETNEPRRPSPTRRRTCTPSCSPGEGMWGPRCRPRTSLGPSATLDRAEVSDAMSSRVPRGTLMVPGERAVNTRPPWAKPSPPPDPPTSRRCCRKSPGRSRPGSPIPLHPSVRSVLQLPNPQRGKVGHQNSGRREGHEPPGVASGEMRFSQISRRHAQYLMDRTEHPHDDGNEVVPGATPKGPSHAQAENPGYADPISHLCFPIGLRDAFTYEEKSHASESPSCIDRLHADRVAGRHRDHRRADRPAAAGRPGGPRGGPPQSSAPTTSSRSAWRCTTTTRPTTASRPAASMQTRDRCGARRRDGAFSAMPGCWASRSRRRSSTPRTSSCPRQRPRRHRRQLDRPLRRGSACSSARPAPTPEYPTTVSLPVRPSPTPRATTTSPRSARRLEYDGTQDRRPSERDLPVSGPGRSASRRHRRVEQHDRLRRVEDRHRASKRNSIPTDIVMLGAYPPGVTRNTRCK